MANLRFQVVEEAFKKRPVEVIAPVERPSEYFGKYVFTVPRCTNICLQMSTTSLLPLLTMAQHWTAL